MKNRQSTTRPVSRKMARELQRYCEAKNCGVMLRHQGQDVAIDFLMGSTAVRQDSPRAQTHFFIECLRIKALTIATIRRELLTIWHNRDVASGYAQPRCTNSVGRGE